MTLNIKTFYLLVSSRKRWLTIATITKETKIIPLAIQNVFSVRADEIFIHAPLPLSEAYLRDSPQDKFVLWQRTFHVMYAVHMTPSLSNPRTSEILLVPSS
jgi:hypothetical protein